MGNMDVMDIIGIIDIINIINIIDIIIIIDIIDILQHFTTLEDQPAFGRLTSSSCGGLGDRRDPDTSDASPRACGARLGLDFFNSNVFTLTFLSTLKCFLLFLMIFASKIPFIIFYSGLFYFY